MLILHSNNLQCARDLLKKKKSSLHIWAANLTELQTFFMQEWHLRREKTWVWSAKIPQKTC